MISYFKVDAMMTRRAVNHQGYQAPVQQEHPIQQKIGHIQSEFKSKANVDDAFEMNGKKDALDNEFEEY